jgi:hypothetical protein
MHVPYPEGATGEGIVVVEVVVGADGGVRQMKLMEGTEPFASAAIAAAAAFKYAPATRDGQPIAARFHVRMRVAADEVDDFIGWVRPPPPLPGTPEKVEPDPKTRDPNAPLEVVIAGTKVPTPPPRPPAEVTLEREDVRKLPGAFGDAFRAVEVLPGVVPLASGLPFFFVRGATPASTGYFLDQIRIPFLFHIGAGPSVINPALVRDVEFHPGGYPAQLGRFVGGVVTAQVTPPSPRMRAEATVRLFDAGAYVEVPLANGRATAFAGGRYSYTAAALSLFAPDLRLSYWDYQAGGTYQVNARDRVTVFGFGSDDFLGEKKGEETQELFGAQFHRLQVKLDHTPSSPMGTKAKVALVVGFDRSALADQGIVRDPMAAMRADFEIPLSSMVTLRTGAEINLDKYDYSPSDGAAIGTVGQEENFRKQFLIAFAARDATTFGGYVDAVIKPRKYFEITPGLRMDLFTEEAIAQASLDPRLSVRVKIAPFLSEVSTFGMAHQRPSLIVPVPGLEPRGLDKGLQEVVALSHGAELTLPEAIRASVTFFHHSYRQLTDLAATCSARVTECIVAHRADGRAYGLELSASRSLSKKVGGIISYTLSRAERTFQGENFLSDFDRTHVLNVAVGWEFLPSWFAGARLTAYSGRPFSLLVFDDESHPEDPQIVGERNALRRAGFYRLDLRFEKRWKVGARGFVSVVLEGLNVTLQKETVDFDCRIAAVGGSGGDISCGGQEIGPITIPSIGVQAGF